MNIKKPELIYDGFETNELYLTKLELEGQSVMLSDLLRNCLTRESAKKEVGDSRYDSIVAKCDELYMTPYFYKFENGNILIIGFGEFQPGRYMLYKF